MLLYFLLFSCQPTVSGASSEIPDSFSLVMVDINNLVVSGNVGAKNPLVVGSKNPLIIGAELGDLHIIDSRETSKHKRFVCVLFTRHFQ